MKLTVVFAIATFCSTSLWAAAQDDAPGAPDLVKGQATAVLCSACHASDGSRGNPQFPILEGQHPDYIYKQLTEFKSGQRNNVIMKGMASTLSDQDMRNVAAYYASKSAAPGFSKDKDLAAEGQKIYRGGIAEKHVPACEACHGPSGAGIPAQYPRMAGQHSEYIESQLTAFRSGLRINSVPMMTIGSRLSDAEMKALADYVTGLR